MNKKQIPYDYLLYEVNSEKENSVSLIESSGLFSHSAKYGSLELAMEDTEVLSIPELIEDEKGVKYIVTEIRRSVFDNSDTLQEVRIPRSVTKIEWGFWACLNLKAIVVDPDNPAYCDVDGVLYTKDGSTLIAFPNKHGKEYKVKEGTLVIEHFAFKDTDITGIEVPSSLREIRNNAFYRCSSLRYVSARGIKWPITISPMTGDHGDVNPLFHYSWFSVRMKNPFHEQRFCELLPSEGTVVESFPNGLSLVRVEYDYHEYYGVCNNLNSWIIRPLFSTICAHYNIFFEASIITGDDKSQDSNDVAECERKKIWFNSNGERLYQKQLIELSESLLLYDSSGEGYGRLASPKGTLYSFKGEEILDSVEGYREIEGRFFFTVGGKIGIYDNTGKEVLPVEYYSLENVSFCPYNTVYSNGKYKEYVLNNVFDTNEQQNKGKREHVTIMKGRDSIYSKGGITINEISSFSFQYPFILHGDKHYLFSLETGIVQNSAFDGIYPISDKWYVVKDGPDYGVFDFESQSLILPCIYDRIIYQGSNVILVCKEGLWGALSFGFTDCDNTVSIPTEYYEIKILNKDYSLFGVKMKALYWDKVEFRYTILDSNGEEYKNMGIYRDLDSQFLYYNEDRVLTSRNKKFGFISTDGHVTIPFKYDQIYSRDDGSFNVSVDHRWGVLSLEGREVVPVKYQYVGYFNKEQIDKRLSEDTARALFNRVVIDAESEGVGVLNADGAELVPTKYEYILDGGDLFYYAHKRTKKLDECENNWFDAQFWGVLDSEGREITKPIYKCFDRRGKWLLAATYADLGYDSQDNDIYIHRVYDLFNLETHQKVFGGIKGIDYTDNPDIILLSIPVVRHSFDIDDNPILAPCSWAWDDWERLLLVDFEKLQSVVPTATGHRFQFNLGDDIHCIYSTDVEGHYEYSHPRELYLEERPRVYANYTIVRQSNTSFLVGNKDGWESPSYSSLFHIEDDCYYSREGDYFGIIVDGKETVSIDEHFIMLTRICKGYCFGAKEIDEKNAEVRLIHCAPEVYDRKIVISKISIRVLSSLLWDNRLCLLVGNEDNSFYVRENTFFDSDVLDSFVVKKELFTNTDEDHLLYKYWFACKNRLLNAETYDDWE